MAEKRKATFIFLLKKPSKNKNHKIELFDKSLFTDEVGYKHRAKQYRLRINGKWFDKKENYEGKKYFNKWEFRDLLWRSIEL